jgi:hypothetical protein
MPRERNDVTLFCFPQWRICMKKLKNFSEKKVKSISAAAEADIAMSTYFVIRS